MHTDTIGYKIRLIHNQIHKRMEAKKQEKEKKKPRGHRNVIQLRETCHSEAVTDVTAVGIRIQNVRENGLPRQSADWLAMTKPLTEWHWSFLYPCVFLCSIPH